MEPAKPTPLVKELVDLIRSRTDVSSLRVERVVVGVFYTGVKLNTGHGGVAFTPIHEIPDAVCCPKSFGKMPSSGRLTELSLEEVFEYPYSRSPLVSAVGVAALNAVSQKIISEKSAKYDIVYDKDALDLAGIGPEDTVAMIGAFTPYIKRLKGNVKNLYVIERNPRALSGFDLHVHPEEASKDLLLKADVVIVSGASIVNQTIDGILGLASQAREIILSGPTASMMPEPFFKRGVSVMGGVKIDNADRMLEIVSQAGSAYTLFKECAVKMAVRKPLS
ncbi:DUF364 domain-containing protein [Candidatus Hecatella orcuttiae]|uniref:DUF364 domain-containing protein n=1 Tax=Candidatus Hecatella orcuttiae TaxID=1935119 RepID=UPI002867C484|nr:DUF364 domain-containing protein [Candidatus Hecatella orcuttiae]